MYEVYSLYSKYLLCSKECMFFTRGITRFLRIGARNHEGPSDPWPGPFPLIPGPFYSHCRGPLLQSHRGILSYVLQMAPYLLSWSATRWQNIVVSTTFMTLVVTPLPPVLIWQVRGCMCKTSNTDSVHLRPPTNTCTLVKLGPEAVLIQPPHPHRVTGCSGCTNC